MTNKLGLLSIIREAYEYLILCLTITKADLVSELS